jgi:hypothetical protein
VSFCRCSLFYEEGQGPERAAAETPWPLLLLDENREAGAGTSGSAVEDTCLLRTFLDASELLPGGHVFSVPGAGYCDFFPRKTSKNRRARIRQEFWGRLVSALSIGSRINACTRFLVGRFNMDEPFCFLVIFSYTF